MKFAFLVMCELRGVKSTIDGLYKNLINQYDADIFICVQKTFPDDEERMNLFKEKVVYRELYDRPDPVAYFGENNISNVGHDRDANWNAYSNLQIYINYHKMAKVIENVYDQYEYFIILRTDSQILFPFPDKQLFEIAPETIYLTDSNYCKIWGDIGFPGIIHKKYILELLNCYYNSIVYHRQYILEIINCENIELNQERFFYVCLRVLNLLDKIKKIKNLNYFWTAEIVNDYTTWSIPHMHPTHNVISKYDDQCDEAYSNSDLWNSGNYLWGINKTDFTIELMCKKLQRTKLVLTL
jgi:hypothetical protein